MSDGLIRSPDPPRDATVVVIGGGVMGTSIAYQLARAGIRDLVLLEADDLASGSSGKPLGGVRAQFSDPANMPPVGQEPSGHGLPAEERAG